MPDANTALGFDVGARRIGIAVGNRISASASALTVIDARDPDAQIDALVARWRPDALVIGLPLALDGEEQPASKSARRFAAQLGKRHALPVYLIDERYSSVEAGRRFAQQRALGGARRKHAASLDAIAATVILENWLSTPDPEPI